MSRKIFKLELFTFCSALVFFSFFLNSAQATLDGSLSFTQANISGIIGQTTTLTARINPGSNQIGSMELNIAFNPAVLRLESMISTGVFNTVTAGPTINNTAGTAVIDLSSTNPTNYIETTSNVVNLTFTVLALAINSPISILPGSDAISSLGQNTINSRTGSWVTTSMSGMTLRSDVNNSGSVTTVDALLTLRNSLGLSLSGTNWQTSSITGDVNCDGFSRTVDALLILRKSLELDMTTTAWCEG